jgi:hypothetical protein
VSLSATPGCSGAATDELSSVVVDGEGSSSEPLDSVELSDELPDSSAVVVSEESS